ncbi:hypothetical protein BZL29_1024 [Mycobacterium kansasii]|uniref:Uncharacterized protein n=1 Tax=Mycobacterium kansasii TaxID=1768 RepID=A0A1V3XYK5_MYCKA|nr:hypothetical protein BZL29_1024 [Mycobacterium kansasii]
MLEKSCPTVTIVARPLPNQSRKSSARRSPQVTTYRSVTVVSEGAHAADKDPTRFP